MDAYAMAQAIRMRELSPQDAVEQSLARIEALDDQVNAFTVTLADEAREAARDAALRAEAGESLPLLGVPSSIIRPAQ
jgi:Asp-tRNA(Asn)/Glu-tRNA(Gln) amidotransferase A subunit family amidase